METQVRSVMTFSSSRKKYSDNYMYGPRNRLHKENRMPPSFLQPGHVPKLDGLVLAARRQCSAIGAESHLINTSGVTFQGIKQSPGCHIPKPDILVVASRGQSVAVRAEGNRKAPDLFVLKDVYHLSA